MDAIATANDVGEKLLDALGLPKGHTHSLDLHIEANKPIEVTVKRYVTNGQFGRISEELESGRYTLVADATREKIAIWDIDNCLADDSNRIHLIDWSKQGDERYALYNSYMGQDEVENAAVFSALRAQGVTPVFFTGRPEMFREETAWWLFERLDVRVDESSLYMRPNGTVGLTPTELKRGMLKRLLATGVRIEEIVRAFDDLPQVVAMYREFGIDGVQLAIGNPEAAYDPADLAEGQPA